MRNLPLLSILSFLILLGCSKVEDKRSQAEAAKTKLMSVFPTDEEEKTYIADLLAFRAEKDSFLKTSRSSPLRKEERSTFRGLKYYEPDPNFIVRATLQRNANPPTVTITTTTGTNRKALKYGYLDFTLQGRTHRLLVFKFTDGKTVADRGYLFVAFTDSTSGEETYGAGRYIDLEENETGDYVLDFNRAYNPYCAYNEDYSCPIPPRENRLAMAVRAGEKVYH